MGLPASFTRQFCTKTGQANCECLESRQRLPKVHGEKIIANLLYAIILVQCYNNPSIITVASTHIITTKLMQPKHHISSINSNNYH